MTDEYEELKAQKQEELKQKFANQKHDQEKEQEAYQQLDATLRKILEPDAKVRLSNVRLVNQEAYLKTSQALLYLYQQGQIKKKITDIELKQLLGRVTAKKETTIKRK